MSGFTTTGATVIVDFSKVSKSLFMWRAFTQWMGGVGIIVLFIAVFPQLAIAGRQLFFAEAPGPTDDRLTPRLRYTSNAVLIVYTILTLFCALGYKLAGMSVYEAIAHAFTTLAAGGFSPNPLSFATYSPLIMWLSVIFMFLAGANFTLQYRAMMGQPGIFFKDVEFRAYTVIALSASIILALILRNTYEPLEALRHAFFQVLSILTTTGFASVDFALWVLPAQSILIILMFIGGCAGSGAGGVKVVRWLMIAQNTRREIEKILHPRAVLPIHLGKQLVPEEVMRSVAAFITLYIGLFATSTMLLVWFGADFTTAFSASIACLGNVGPGISAEVGPMASFATLHPFSRGLLTFMMYAGRLEVVVVFIILNGSFWRLPRVR